MKVLKFSQIRIDGGTQMRVSINQDKVSEYAEKMREDGKFPPLKATFDGTVYWLYDGFHRYFAAQAAGATTIEVDYKPGTMEDAQDLALGANDDHGLPRSNEDKRKAVETALAMERHSKKSDREIGRLCKVSHTLVAAVRNPDVKKQQTKNNLKSLEKSVAKDEDSGVSSTGVSSTPDPKVELTQDYGPDEQELKANELAQQADLEAMNKLLESDDALATAHAEVKRLNHLVSQLQVRISVLMREKNSAIDMVKEYQAKEKKAKK
jgi:hypothetical protein